MISGMLVLVVIVVALLFAVMFVIGIYNKLVTLRNRFKNAWAQIDVQLKRRYDLIPNLVETAKGYLKHERGTLEAVIAARNAASSANTRVAADPSNPEAMKALIAAEGTLSGTLGRLFALSEAYPDLKANTNFMQLQGELTSTENIISGARNLENAKKFYEWALTPAAQEMAAAAKQFQVPSNKAAKGDPRNLTQSPGVHERWPAWSPCAASGSSTRSPPWASSPGPARSPSWACSCRGSRSR